MQSSHEFYNLWYSEQHKNGFNYLQSTIVEDEDTDSRSLKARRVVFSDLNNERQYFLVRIEQYDWMKQTQAFQNQKDKITVINTIETVNDDSKAGSTILLELHDININSMINWCQKPHIKAKQPQDVSCTEVNESSLLSFLAESYLLSNNMFQYIIHCAPTSVPRDDVLLAFIGMAKLKIPVFIWAHDLAVIRDWLSIIKNGLHSSITILVANLNPDVDFQIVLCLVDKFPNLYTCVAPALLATVISDIKSIDENIEIRAPENTEESLIAMLGFYLQYHIGSAGNSIKT